jgi:hypothetical protein
MKHLYGISGKEEYLALKQLEKENEQVSVICKIVENYFDKRNKMTEQEKEDLAQEMGEL